MATVTGLTAARMLAIEAASVVDGEVDAEGHLILTTQGGTEINAGNVIGPQGVGPTGTVSLFAGSIAPAEHLLCDGAAISRTTYSALFSVIGTLYGAGDGFTTFNVPNLKGRFPVGLDTSQTEFDTLGDGGGEKTHTLTVDEIPSHNHTQDPHNHVQDAHNHVQDAHNHTQNSHNHTQNAHGHTLSFGSGGLQTGDRITWAASQNAVGSDPDAVSQTTATNQAATATNQAATATNQAATATNQAATATNQPTGGGLAHNNLPPFVVMNYIIRI